MNHQGEPSRFLTDERVAEAATLIEPLIRDGFSWIDRRKEKVEILDDTSLRRQISVDFSLRRTAVPLLEKEAEGVGNLYCAPVFVLPKAPPNLMAFDLEDEDGHSLSLVGRADNARISGALLELMAKRIIDDLPEGLRAELVRLAEADAGTGVQLARRLKDPDRSPWPGETETLVGDARFAWWLGTLAHSSVVPVLYRSTSPRRKLVKLRFEQPIATDQPWDARLGWKPYRVGIDSSLVEARRFHFEAEAPPGLRITQASFSDDGSTDPVTDSGFLRRVHLYRAGAQESGAGTAVLWLRVSGLGFVGGAPLAAFLTTAALVACAVGAPEIAANPSSAPALLLALPGLIAAYIGRGDQHALTTRLLSSARRLLLVSAFIAYVGATRVALLGGATIDPVKVSERTDNLRTWLVILILLSLVPLVGLAIAWARARVQPGFLSRRAELHRTAFVAAPPDRVFEVLRSGDVEGVPADYELVEHDHHRGEVLFAREHWHGALLLNVCVEDDGHGDTLVGCDGEYVGRLGGLPVARVVLPRLDDEAATLLADLQKSF